MAKTCAGIDIGSANLKIAVCEDGNIRRLSSFPMPENIVKGGMIVSPEAMADFIRECAKRDRIGTHDCSVILPSQLAFFRRLTMPGMTIDQLKYNLPYEFRDYITLEKEKYYYDYAVEELKKDDNGIPTEMDLTAAAVPKAVIADYTAMLRRAGFKLACAAPVECAYANLLRRLEGEQSAGEYCILDLGHSTTRIYIYTAGRFEVTRVIEHGCSLVDAAIADAYNVDEHIARAYKESNHEDAQRADGPMGVYNAIAVEIRKAVSFYRFNSPESQLENIYLCGGGARIEPLCDTIASMVDLHLCDISALVPPGADGTLSGLCAAAVGIAQ